MVSHLYHDREEFPTRILFDGCERCEEHADTLYDLDEWHLLGIVRRGTEAFEGLRNDLSFAERRALDKIRVAAMVLQRAGYTVEGPSAR